LKLKYDKLLSNFAFNFNLRPSSKAVAKMKLRALSVSFEAWSELQRHAKVGRCSLRAPGLEAVDPTLAFRHFQGLSALETEI